MNRMRHGEVDPLFDGVQSTPKSIRRLGGIR